MRFKRKQPDTEELLRAVRRTHDPLEKLTDQLRAILPLMQQLEPEDAPARREYEEALHALERLQRTNEALAARAEEEPAPAPDTSPPEPAAKGIAPAQGDGEAERAQKAAENAPAQGDQRNPPAQKETTLSRRVQILFDRSASAESAEESALPFSLFGSRRRHLPPQETFSASRRPAPQAADAICPLGPPAGPSAEPPVTTPEPSARTAAQVPGRLSAAQAAAPVSTPADTPARASARTMAKPPAAPESPTPLLSKTDAPAPPVPPMYQVQFSVVMPRPLLRGEDAVLHLFMTEKDLAVAVEDLLQQDPSGSRQALRGTAVRVALQSPDLALPCSSLTRTWPGDYLRFDFALPLPETYSKRQVLFNAVVYINEVIATRLRFLVNCAVPGPQILTPRRRDVLSAFLSYAGEDRARAEALLQSMQQARPDLHVFFDVESLRSSETWRESLPREIARRDVFFLCWSHYAKDSFWVNWEWNCALKAKTAACIELIPLESPDRCPPPRDLDGRHFNDHLLYMMNALQNGT